MTDWPAARAGAVTALEPLMGSELIHVFDELLPRQRWRDAIPAEHWLRAGVLAAISEHGDDRRHLHRGFIDLVGERNAATLMEYLVPAPWTVLEALGVPVGNVLRPADAAA